MVHNYNLPSIFLLLVGWVGCLFLQPSFVEFVEFFSYLYCETKNNVLCCGSFHLPVTGDKFSLTARDMIKLYSHRIILYEINNYLETRN